MHSAVLQNKKYIMFAEKNTVEVIALSRLQEGVDKKERLAATYTAKRDGVATELMVEYPNLTLEEMLAVNSSPAGRYNDTGLIPYTSVVDPHSLKELRHWSGGQSSSTIMDAVGEVRKQLTREYGKAPVTRRDLAKLYGAESDAQELAMEGEFAKALKSIDGALPGDLQELPEVLRVRITSARGQVIRAAEQALADVLTLADEDLRKAKANLSRISSRLKGTGLEARAVEMKAGLQDLESARP